MEIVDRRKPIRTTNPADLGTAADKAAEKKPKFAYNSAGGQSTRDLLDGKRAAEAAKVEACQKPELSEALKKNEFTPSQKFLARAGIASSAIGIVGLGTGIAMAFASPSMAVIPLGVALVSSMIAIRIAKMMGIKT